MTGFEAIDCTTDLQIMPNSFGRVDYLIDSIVDTNKITFQNLGDNRDVKVYLQTTFNIIVSGIDLQLSIYDKDGVQVFSTTFTDTISEIITYFYIEYVTGIGGVGAVQIEEAKQPFSIVISKAGYLDIFLDNIEVIPGQETTIRANLQSPIYADPVPDVSIDSEPTTIAIVEIETE